MHELHHQKGPIVVEVEVVDPHQVRMLQIDQQLAFVDQARLVISTNPAAGELEHQVVAQLDVDDPVDVGLAAAVEQSDNLVFADGIGQRPLPFGCGPGRGDRRRPQPIGPRSPDRSRPGIRLSAGMVHRGVELGRRECRLLSVVLPQCRHLGLEPIEPGAAHCAAAHMVSDLGWDGLNHRKRE